MIYNVQCTFTLCTMYITCEYMPFLVLSNKNNSRRSEVDVPVLKKREVTEIVKRCCAGWTEDANGDCLTREF